MWCSEKRLNKQKVVVADLRHWAQPHNQLNSLLMDPSRVFLS